MRPQDFKQWRVVEITPGVFGLEYRRRLFSSILNFRTLEALGWGWHDWNLIREERFGSKPKTFESALAATNAMLVLKSAHAEDFYNEVGLPGYPKIVNT